MRVELLTKLIEEVKRTRDSKHRNCEFFRSAGHHALHHEDECIRLTLLIDEAERDTAEWAVLTATNETQSREKALLTALQQAHGDACAHGCWKGRYTDTPHITKHSEICAARWALLGKYSGVPR